MRTRILFSLFAVLTAASMPAATRIKLGTLAPVGTSYHKALMAMGESWRKDTGGAVELTIYAGGKLGGEAEMVGLMQMNSLQCAMLTAVGLKEIEPAVTGLQNIPMGFRSLAEVDYVGDNLRPMLEALMEEKGYVVLFWTDTGWVRFFSSRAVVHPDDLRHLKLFTWAGDPRQVTLMRSAGFDPVPIETADIVPGLQTGLIESVPMPPFFALATQIDLRARFMLELNWAPLVGACVIRREAWERLSPEHRKALLAAALIAGEETKASGRRESAEAVAAMQKRGLIVTPVTPEIEGEWRKTAESVYPRIRGALVPADVFDRALELLAEVRAKNASQQPAMEGSFASH